MSRASTSSIPLLCSICPKLPHFSDTSHLLTHIASKSHLSHKFHLQIRAQHEIAASEQLDQFNAWYENYGLGQMLSDRLAMKDKDRKGSRRRSSTHTIKIEEGRTPSVPPPPAPTPIQSFRAPMPFMHTWDHDVPRYATPTMGQTIPNFSHHETPDNLTKISVGSDETEEYEDEEDNSCKPKGIFWPGMGLFDAATPEMKRRRNQKKDASVLIAMKRSSRDTQQHEYEYEQSDLDWELKRVRDIFGPLSTDNTPIKNSNPSKRYNTRQKQGPLSTVSSNVNRAKKSYNLLNFQTPKSRPKPTHPRVLRSSTKTGSPFSDYMSRRYEPSAEEDQEFRQAMEEIGGNDKKVDVKRWGIFRSPGEIMASPSRTESPLEDHRFDFPQGFALQPSISVSEQMTPTRVFKPIPTRTFEKENILDLPNVKQNVSSGEPYQMPYYQHNPFYTQSAFSAGPYYGEPLPDWKPVMDNTFQNSNHLQQMGSHNANNINDNANAFNARF